MICAGKRGSHGDMDMIKWLGFPGLVSWGTGDLGGVWGVPGKDGAPHRSWGWT